MQLRGRPENEVVAGVGGDACRGEGWVKGGKVGRGVNFQYNPLHRYTARNPHNKNLGNFR